MPTQSSRPRKLALWAAALAVSVLLIALGRPARDAAPDPQEQQLRVGLSDSVSSLDPHTRPGEPELQILENIYEGLVGTDENMGVTPGIAVGWAAVDDHRWVFELRESVRFHDGSLLGPEDVVFSMQRAAEKHSAWRLRARAIGGNRVELEVDRPDPLFLVRLRDISIVPLGFDAAGPPVGTGPYQMVDLDNDRGWFQLRAFADYWGGLAAISEALLSVIPDPETRLQRLLEGELELINRLPQGRASSVAATQGLRLLSVSGHRAFHLTLRVDRPPFDDLRVRQAVNLALDRQALVDASEAGHAVALGQFAPSAVHGHHPEIPVIGRDLVRARELLTEAGYPGGLDFVLEGAGRPAAFERLANQLRLAGFRPEVRLMPWAEFYSRLKAGKVDLTVMAWNFTAPDLSEFLDECGHTPSLELGLGARNWSGYSNPAFDHLVQQLMLTSDPSGRLELMAAAQRQLLEDLPLIPLYSPLVILASTETLRWEPRPNGFIYLFDMSWYSPSQGRTAQVEGPTRRLFRSGE